MKRATFGFGSGVSALGLLVLVACGGEDHAPIASDEGAGGPLSPPRSTRPPVEGGASPGRSDDGDSESSTSRGEDASLDTGSLAEGGAPSSGVVQIEMLTPADANEPEVVYDHSLEVSCRIVGMPAEGDASLVGELDPATVTFELLDEEDVVLDSIAGGRAAEADVFEATFPVQNVESGAVRARCRASDAATQPTEVSAEATFFVDHGPLVTVITPEANAAESVLGAVAFEYQVEPDELVRDDEAAAVTSVTLSLLGKSFELVERDDEPGVYRTTVDFQDPKVFKEPPTGEVQVAVEATNERGVTKVENYNFVLDGAGPAVSIIAPANGLTIGGKVTLSLVAVDDVSNVDWNTLVVSLNDEPYPYQENGPWSIDAETAAFTFETSEIEGSIEQITVNVLVSDFAGNKSPGAAALYYRDEKPPRISMNPPNFRAVNSTTKPELCSIPFDPLGVAAQDGDRVHDLARYRALVWDETNMATFDPSTPRALHPAYVNRESVDLFVRRPGEPLVIDTTGDGECDDIQEEGTRFQQLTALTPGGSATFLGESETHRLTDSPAIPEGKCILRDEAIPSRLCAEGHSDLTIVVGHAVAKTEPLVYAVSPTDSLECTGKDWELPSAGLSSYQGWVCLAVRAFDNVGNRSVSAPIAVCLDNSQVEGEPDCWPEGNDEDKPDCTDGCTPPPEIEAQFLRQ